jgi:hypothetical protein
VPVYVFQIETRLLMSHEPLRFELLHEFDDEPQICHLAESRRPDGATESGAAARPTPSAHQGGFLKWAQFSETRESTGESRIGTGVEAILNYIA